MAAYADRDTLAIVMPITMFKLTPIFQYLCTHSYLRSKIITFLNKIPIARLNVQTTLSGDTRLHVANFFFPRGSICLANSNYVFFKRSLSERHPHSSYSFRRMSKNLYFERCNNQRENVRRNETTCDVNENQQSYQNCKAVKGVEYEQRVKFITNGVDCDGGAVFKPKSRRDGSVESNSSRCSNSSERQAHPLSASARPDASPVRRPPANRSQKNVATKTPTTSRYQDDHDRPSAEEVYKKCYPMRHAPRIVSCDTLLNWQTGKYTRDDCGSGILPVRANYAINRRKLWCSTPLTTYQAMHGELGRKILCGEISLSRRINPDPPCSMCEIVQPLCRGYYRKYECDFSPCEKDYVLAKGLTKPRTKIQRYWEPCMTHEDLVDVRTFAPHNMALARDLRKKLEGTTGEAPCW